MNKPKKSTRQSLICASSSTPASGSDTASIDGRTSTGDADANTGSSRKVFFFSFLSFFVLLYSIPYSFWQK
jgi:hypothetical protein